MACKTTLVIERPADKSGDFDLDHVSMHTLRHYECVCPDEFFYACTPGRD